MGKRKAAKKQAGPKKKEPLATTFKCVFCAHENSVTVKIDKKQGVGNLSCKSCTQTFQTNTNYLTQAVDVYADWIDACDAVAKDTAGAEAAASRPIQPHPASSSRALPEDDKATEEDDGFIDDADADPEEDFAED